MPEKPSGAHLVSLRLSLQAKKICGQQTLRLAIRSFSEGWWIQTDLNRRPGDYESPALTD